MLDDSWIELGAFIIFKLAQNYFGRKAAAVTALAVHSVKGVANADYSCDKRNILAAFTCGIAFAVIALMVVNCAELNIIYRCEIPEDTFLGSKLSRQHGDNIIDAVSCGNLFGLNIIKDIRVNVHFPLYKGIKVAFPDKDELANIICQQNLLVIKPAESQRKKSIISHKITVW